MQMTGDGANILHTQTKVSKDVIIATVSLPQVSNVNPLEHPRSINEGKPVVTKKNEVGSDESIDSIEEDNQIERLEIIESQRVRESFWPKFDFHRQLLQEELSTSMVRQYPSTGIVQMESPVEKGSITDIELTKQYFTDRYMDNDVQIIQVTPISRTGGNQAVPPPMNFNQAPIQPPARPFVAPPIKPGIYSTVPIQAPQLGLRMNGIQNSSFISNHRPPSSQIPLTLPLLNPRMIQLPPAKNPVPNPSYKPPSTINFRKETTIPKGSTFVQTTFPIPEKVASSIKKVSGVQLGSMETSKQSSSSLGSQKSIIVPNPMPSLTPPTLQIPYEPTSTLIPLQKCRKPREDDRFIYSDILDMGSLIAFNDTFGKIFMKNVTPTPLFGSCY
jgi:hypothetical protein